MPEPSPAVSSAADEEGEVVDAVPVLHELPGRDGEPSAAAVTPAAARRGGLVRRVPSAVVTQAAAVAVTSFAAGALTVAASRRRRGRKVTARRPQPRPVEALEVVGTRRFLVDVHLLAERPR